MYLNEIPEYRDTIMEQLSKSDKIVGLLRPDDKPNMKSYEMVYKCIFPYDHIIDKASDVGTYICFDIVSPRVIDRAFVDLRIYFWVIAHDRCMRTANGLVTDLVCGEIDRVMNGSKDFGLGTVELMDWNRFAPADCFHGRSLVYRTVDFNRK